MVLEIFFFLFLIYLFIYLHPNTAFSPSQPSQSPSHEWYRLPFSEKVGHPWVSPYPSKSSLYNVGASFPLRTDMTVLLRKGFHNQTTALRTAIPIVGWSIRLSWKSANMCARSLGPASICSLGGGSDSEPSQRFRLVDSVVLSLEFLLPWEPSFPN